MGPSACVLWHGEGEDYPPAGSFLVLQVFPLQPCGIFYNLFADDVAWDFAAAQVFFLKQDHSVVVHDCANPAAFQLLFPCVMLRNLSLLLASIISQGHIFLLG